MDNGKGCHGSWLLTGAGGPGPSASPPLLSLEEPGLCRGPGDIRGPTPQSPVGLELCTGYSKEKDGLVSFHSLFLTDHFTLESSSTLTCSSNRWICSESSWISESRDGAGLGAGGVKTSSFRGALWGCKGQFSPFPTPAMFTLHHPQRDETWFSYVRTLWRPNTKATLRLQGCTKPAQLVSMVTYSPFRAQKRIGEWSKGWPANCRTVGAGKKVGISGWESRIKQRKRHTEISKRPGDGDTITTAAMGSWGQAGRESRTRRTHSSYEWPA